MSTGEELPHSKEAATSIFKACAVKDDAGNYILHNVGNYLPVDVASIPKNVHLHQHRRENLRSRKQCFCFGWSMLRSILCTV
jgi:hypothetical protein